MTAKQVLSLKRIACLILSIGLAPVVAPLPSRATAGVSAARWSALVPALTGRNFYVAANGNSGNSGTIESPWDLKSALSGAKTIAPGDVVWIRGGTYKGTFKIRLAGEKDKPIHIRAYPEERATILDSRTNVVSPSRYLWIWGLEFASSVPIEKRRTEKSGTSPKNIPTGNGLNIVEGTGCKFINLVVHDNVGNGITWWTPSVGGEIHGCLIYNNGWSAPDRGHGHCIYTQNRDGTKIISGSILTVPSWGGFMTMHAFGSKRAWVNNYLIQDNIAYERGRFLIGGSRPSKNIRVLRNYIYGLDLQLGFDAPYNEDCEVKNNVVIGGRIRINNFKKVIKQGNVLDPYQARPVLIRNKYDPSRANAAVFNPSNATQSKIPVQGFLNPGDAYKILDPKDFFGKPVAEGICKGPDIVVPMNQPFSAFVIIKK